MNPSNTLNLRKNLASLKNDVFVIKNIDQVLEYVHGMFSEGGDKGLETSEVLCAPSGLENCSKSK